MLKTVTATIVMLAVPVLAGCGASGGASTTAQQAPVSQAPETIIKGKSPVQLYSDVARRVRACWLNPRDPVLSKHIFRAEAGAGGRSGRVTQIVIHEQTSDQKRGLKAFSIDFTPLRGGTRIIANNHKLPYALGQKLMSDVGYWAQGGPNCDGPAVAAGAGPRGSVSGRR